MNDSLTVVTDWIQKHLKLVIGAVAALVVILTVVGVVNWINSINNEAFDRQRAVFTTYNFYQTELSTCLDNTQLSSQIAQAEYAQVKDVLTAVVAARYVNANGQPTRADAVLGGGQFISALQEQYPQIDRSLWKQLMTTAIGCRNQVAGRMNNLQAIAGRFDTWTNTGGILEKQVRHNWPNDQLKVIGLNGPLTGRAALEFLTQPVLTSDASTAVRTHQMPQQQLFPSSSATK